MRRLILLIVLLINISEVYAQLDLQKPFKDCAVEGSITLYDQSAKMWYTSDIEDSQKATLPASTFKIINTLIALETGVIKNETEIVKWPGAIDTIKYGYRPDIFRDMTVQDAFKYSAGWVYVQLAKRIGKSKYKEYLTACNYGNIDLSIEDDDFWNFGNFAISPVNQIQILQGVYEETLPFSKKHFNILKNMMIVERGENYIIRAKTGWTRDGGKDTGWWVGYVEKDTHVYFFATRLIKDRSTLNPDFGKCRKEITKTILRQMHIIQ